MYFLFLTSTTTPPTKCSIAQTPYPLLLYTLNIRWKMHYFLCSNDMYLNLLKPTVILLNAKRRDFVLYRFSG